MTWNDLYPKINQPSMDDISQYVGNFETMWHGIRMCAVKKLLAA